MKKSPKGPWVIIMMALLMVAVMLILGNQSFKATEKAAFDEFNQRQLVLARGAAGGIELYFGTLTGDLRALGRMPQVQHLDEAPTRREIQHTFDQLEPLGVNDVGVLDANGVLRCNVMAHQIEGVDFSWRRYYQEAKGMTSDDTYVVEFVEFKGVEAGQKGVLVAVPLFETATDENHPPPSGQFAGVVLCTLKVDTITQRFVAPIQSSERGHAFVIDDEHHVLWSPDKSLFGRNLLEESAGFPAFQQIVGRMSAGNLGAAEYSYYKYEDSTGEYTKEKKEEKLIAYAPIHLGNEVWAIGVWAPKEDARQLIRSVYLRQLFVVGLSLLTIVLGSSYSLAAFYRTSKFLEKEVETKTGELKESHGRLLTVLDSLEAAHAFRQAIIDGVAESIMVIGIDYRVQLMNRAAREFSSRGADASESLLCHQISHQRETPCDGTEHPCPLAQVRQSGQPVTVVHEHYQANGERRVVEIIASPLWGADGAFQGIIESTRDITERVRAEEILKASEERYRSLFDGVPVGLYRTTSEGQILDVNPALVKMLGYPDRESLLAVNSASIYVAPEDRGRWQALMDREGIVRDAEVQLRRYDGTVIWARDTARAIRNADPLVVYYEGAVEDITERKRAEEALEAARALQQSLIDEERQRIARELHDGLAQLLGYVSTKAMAVRLMLKNRQTEAAHQHLLQLEEAARELFVDVRQAILDLKMTVQSDAGLTATLEDFAAQFSRLSGLPVELAIAPAVESLSLTAEIELQLLRIVQEALTNVRKHASATNAWISLRISDGVLELTVSDDGQGFDPDHVPTTHRPHFGLSTMRERAEAIGAEFDLDSEPGAGTRVTVRLSVVSNQ